jgi:hypothetical protein
MGDRAGRAARLDVKVFPSLDAHDRADAAYWAALTVDMRVLLTWKLSEEQWSLRGEGPHEPGLCRSVAHVFGSTDAPFVGREAFVKNKRASGRARDIADLESLGELPLRENGI